MLKAVFQKVREWRCAWNGHEWPCIWTEADSAFHRTAFLLAHPDISCDRCGLTEPVKILMEENRVIVAAPETDVQMHDLLCTAAMNEYMASSFKKAFDQMSDELKAQVVEALPKKSKGMQKWVMEALGGLTGALGGLIGAKR